MFEIRSCSRAEATDFWRNNSVATAFVAPEVSEKLAPSCEWWIAEKGSEPFVLWPIALNKSGIPALPQFSYYFGPVWSDTAKLRAPSSQFPDRLRAYQAFTDFFVDRYGSLLFELSPQFLDVRAFSWWNYGNPESRRFVIEPRYTAQLRNLQTTSDEKMVAGLRGVRRREIKRVDSENRHSFHSEVSWDNVVELYSLTFRAQGAPIESETWEVLERLWQLVGTEWCSLTVAKEKETDLTVAVVFTIRAKGVSNMVLSVTHPEHKKSGVGSSSVLRSIVAARRHGDDVYDFNGANSPNRGDDKHSFGAEDVLYFRLRLP